MPVCIIDTQRFSVLPGITITIRKNTFWYLYWYLLEIMKEIRAVQRNMKIRQEEETLQISETAHE